MSEREAFSRALIGVIIGLVLGIALSFTTNIPSLKFVYYILPPEIFLVIGLLSGALFEDKKSIKK
ncbi:hypothetical protein [Caldiplasma sukawensis]